MDLTPEEARALHHARSVLAEENWASSDQLSHQWRAELRRALAELADAVEAARGDQQ